MSDIRAFSKQQFLRSGFDPSPYDRDYGPGTYEATLDCKRWCRNSTLLAYLTLSEDGHKIVVPGFGHSGYGGLAELPMGAAIWVEIYETRTGTIFARRSGLMEEGGAGA